MGRKRQRLFRVVCSSRSGDFSADARDFAQTRPIAIGRAQRQNPASREAKKGQQCTESRRTPCFKGARRTTLKIYDWLAPSRSLREEAQVAAVSGFLSFVPFQILKWTRQHSREVISIRSKKSAQRRVEKSLTIVLQRVFCSESQTDVHLK
jgi:hypothetical protein